MKKNALGVSLCLTAATVGGAVMMSILQRYKIAEKFKAECGKRYEKRDDTLESMENAKEQMPVSKQEEHKDYPDCFSVTFYDWDNSYLGTRVVKSGGSLRGDHETPMSRGVEPDEAPKPPEYELLFDAMDNNEYKFYGINDPHNGVCNKRGYLFAGWVDINECSVPVVTPIMARGQQIPRNSLVSLKNIRRDMVLKAAYDEDRMILGANTGTRRYQISFSPFCIKNNSFYTEVTVRRPENARRIPEGEKYLMVTSKLLGWGSFPAKYALGDKDVETMSLSIPMPAERYESDAALCFAVIDMQGEVRSANIWARLENRLSEDNAIVSFAY